MKKLFSYLLISSMVVLSSCTNYDDQFDDLNTQINSLKSQIEGFSSLSSGLTALQATVSSLQSAVNALPKTQTPATDISGLEASVAALQAQLANAATSAQVAAITADLAATQAALEATIASNATDLSALEAAVAALENTDLSDLEAAVAELKTALASAATSAEITALETSIAAAQAAIDALENVDLTDLTASVAALENTDLTEVNTAIAELKAALALLENTDVSGIETSVAALSTLVTATQASIAANATAIGENATSIDALSASLTALTATIAELKATLATVSTAEEVSELAADLVAAQADLDVLLAQSSFYTGAVDIRNQAELDFINTLGNKINVVQGAVTISQTEEMDVTTLTAVMSRFITVTGDVSYTSTSSATTQVPFANLIGTAGLTIQQAGDISLPKLATVNGNLSITGDAATDGDNTLTVSLPVLTSVSKTGGATMAFAGISKATTFSMPSLVEFDGDLSIVIDKTGTIDISKFENDYDLTNAVEDTTGDLLTITAGTLTAPVYVRGRILASKLTSVDLPMWEGTTNSTFVDALTVVLPKITAAAQSEIYDLNTMFTSATSIHIVGNTFTTATPATYEINVDATGQTDVATLILGGTFDDVTLSGNSDLATLTMDVTAESFTLNNSDLSTADIDLVSAVATTNGAKTIAITNNTDLESITVDGADDLNNLNISSNAKLASISFPDLDSSVTAGASGATKPNVTITSNKFTGAFTKATPASTAQTLVSTSGIKELVEFLDDVISKRNATILTQVSIDEATVTTTSTGDVAAATSIDVVKLQTAVSTTVGAINEQKQTVAYVLAQTGSADVNVKIGNDFVFVNALGARADKVLSSNMALAANELFDSAAVSRAEALGVNMSVQSGANVQSITVSFTATNDTVNFESSNPTAATASATVLEAYQHAILTIGSNTVTATSSNEVGGIATALVLAYNAKYTTESSLVQVTDTASRIVVSALAGSANRAHGLEVQIGVGTHSSVTGSAAPLLAYKIANDVTAADANLTTNNKLLGNRIILLLENDAVAATFPLATTVTSTTGIVSLPLTSSLNYASTATFDSDMTGATNAGDVFQDEARKIVNPYYAGTGGTTTVTGENHIVDNTSFL